MNTSTAPAFAEHLPVFTLASRAVTDGGALPRAQYSGAMGIPGGEDTSPHLSWDGAPPMTKSYAVTVHDLDAYGGSGFWHWVVVDIPAGITELPEGAGDDTGSGLPAPAVQTPGDARIARFVGAAPPAGDAPHRYVISVYAVDVESMDIAPDATPTMVGAALEEHAVARAELVATGQVTS